MRVLPEPASYEPVPTALPYAILTRAIDLLCGMIGCLLLLLILPWAALLIKLDSPGPVFFRCTRVGKDGKLFHMFKFRTMYETAQPVGPSVSPRGDPRVTPVGRFLRRLKMNEVPQFINLLLGDMTLVGPRPEAPDLAAAYPPEGRAIFAVKPGLVGPNQIVGRNEEELYPAGVDPRQYYLESILPPKLALDLRYIRKKSLLSDLGYLLQAAWVIVAGAVGRRHLTDGLSQLLLVATDALLCLASFLLAHFLRFEGFEKLTLDTATLKLLGLAALVRLPCFFFCHFYHTLIRHFSMDDSKRLFKGVTLGSLAFAGLVGFFRLVPGYSRAVFFIDWVCLAFLLIGYRLVLKKLYQLSHPQAAATGEVRRVLIWGAGDCGELCLRYLEKKRQPAYQVIGFVDDDHQKRHRRLNGARVLGDRHHLEMLCTLYRVQEIFLAVHRAPPETLDGMARLCLKTGLPTKVFYPEVNLTAANYSQPSLELALAAEPSAPYRPLF